MESTEECGCDRIAVTIQVGADITTRAWSCRRIDQLVHSSGGSIAKRGAATYTQEDRIASQIACVMLAMPGLRKDVVVAKVILALESAASLGIDDASVDLYNAAVEVAETSEEADEDDGRSTAQAEDS